ncbi:hypothetical protein [Carnobacterium maltaromaticum]|nr:hypothetical protein [Carnobacterium maltaromaticum]
MIVVNCSIEISEIVLLSSAVLNTSKCSLRSSPLSSVSVMAVFTAWMY